MNVQQQHLFLSWTHPVALSMVSSRLICTRKKLIVTNTSSCHPAHVTSNISFSLALRIVRICSDPDDRETRFSELKSMLLARDYKSKIIDSCIEKARQIPRQEALKKVVRDKNNPDRMVFVIHYDPRLPSVPASPTATTAPWSRTPT